MPAGRPSEYNNEIAQLICVRLAEGQSLREICRDDDMPSLSGVFKWLAKYDEFVDQYARAKEAGIVALAEEILDIADNANNDYMERLGEDGQTSGYQLNGEHVQRSRLRIDSRKWLLSKLAPKKYGDKITNEHVGKDGGPIKTETKTLEVLGVPSADKDT